MGLNKIRGNIYIIFSFLFFAPNIFHLISYQSSIASQIESSFGKLSSDYFKINSNENYIIGPGDLLYIIVSENVPELDTKVEIDGEGKINLPRLNRIFVKGLNLNELQYLLEKEYKKYILNPSVIVQVLSYRPVKVFVKGEVSSPGLKVLAGSVSLALREKKRFEDSDNLNRVVPNLSNSSRQEEEILLRNKRNELVELRNNSNYFPAVFDAIRQSDGLTPFSDLSNVEIIRINDISNGGGKVRTSLNLQAALNSGDFVNNIRIYDGDIIKINKTDKKNLSLINLAVSSQINPKYIKVYVTGRVNDPGQIIIPRVSSLNDALDISGGPRAVRGKIRFVRFNNNGSMDNRLISYRNRNSRGSYNNPILKSGDLIFVGSSFLSNTAEFVDAFTSPFQGLLSTYGLIKAISD